ncbi:MAG: glycosyltransferase [Faecousia sp.]
MENYEKQILTTLKSYVTYHDGSHWNMVYAISDCREGNAVFRFYIPFPGECQWHLNTDFMMRVSDVCCTGDEQIALRVGSSDDGRETVASFVLDCPGEITLRCAVEALTYEQSVVVLRQEYGNRVANIKILTQSERDLQGALANSRNHVELLLQSERDLQRALAEEKERLTAQIRDLSGENDRLQGEKEKLSGENDRLQGEKEKLSAENDRLRDENDGLSAENDRLLAERRRLREKTAVLDEQTRQLEALRQSAASLETRNQELAVELNNKKGHIELLLESDRELERIHNSRSWKFMGIFWKIRAFLLPVNSRRCAFVKLVLKFLRHPIKCLRKLNKKRIKRLVDGIETGQIQETMQRVDNCLAAEEVHTEPVKLIGVSEEKRETAGDYERFSVPTSTHPLVSIVIPVYNQFHYTYACLKSIAEHSGDMAYEVLIANDCSTDLTTQLEEIVGGVKVITNEKNLRFLLNCNHAAREAKGQYILFLNNDTQVQEDWLRPLVELIESDPAVGMVGSKLIYPDGRLQEAGGILWKDGSAWNYGHLQDPSMPEFNYVKEADYISGASIMIRTRLWKQLGGFDETFAPAYCEDSDLAFQVRAAGYKVLYQPRSVVVHFEGVSNGTDTSSGQKAYQVINSQKFYEKWKDVLEREHNPNAVNPFLARDRSLHKKTLLMVDHYVPQYDRDAGSRTVFQYLKLFVSQGYNVKFIGDNFYQHEPYTTVLQQMGVEVLYGPWYAQHWKEWIQQNGDSIGYVFLNRPHIAVKYIDWIREKTHARIIYYGHDLHFLRTAREAELTGKSALLKDAEDWKEKEFSLMRKADMAYYPSEVEVKEIHRIDPTIAVKAIPAYLFDAGQREEFQPQRRRDLMFVGGYNHGPNVDAVLWMVEKIMPELRKLLPDVKFHMIGSNAPKEVIRLADDHVIYDGMVSDRELDGFYRSCRVSVVPLRYGAGIKGKVVEAMQKGMPVMTTSVGAEGIEDAENILCIEDDPVKFAEKLAALYRSDEELERRSAASQDYIARHFSPANAVKVIGGDFDM